MDTISTEVEDLPLPEQPLEKVVKAKRKASTYNTFIKENYSKVLKFPPKDRFKKLAAMWAKQKKKMK
jgi:hypothetical protein